MAQDWVPPAPRHQPGQPPKRGNAATVALVAVASLVAVAVIGLFGFLLLNRGGEGDTAAVQVASTPSGPAEEEVTQAPTSEPTQTATVFVTVAPQQPADTSQTQGREPAAVELNSSGTLTRDDAVAGIQHYLRVVAGDPASGWDYLTGRRQVVEDWDSYRDYWSSVSSASVSGCTFDATDGALACRLSTVDTSGRDAASDVRFWLTVEDGVTKIDVAGGGGSEQLAAEERLEQERQESLRTLVLDERWIAELSAKRPGISDPLQTAANGTHVFYFPDILAEHDKLVARFPDVHVMMLRREDWGKQGRDLWHTVADPGGMTSKADVQVWCARAFPELTGEALTNQCTPRQLKAPYHS